MIRLWPSWCNAAARPGVAGPIAWSGAADMRKGPHFIRLPRRRRAIAFGDAVVSTEARSGETTGGVGSALRIARLETQHTAVALADMAATVARPLQDLVRR